MVEYEAIQKGIAAHGAWKTRLRNAIASGKFDTPIATVRADNQCEFGKWLYDLPAIDKQSQHFSTVKQLHARFHEEAANVVTVATSGQTVKAEQVMAPSGSYAKASAELTQAMVSWRTHLSS